MRAYVGIGADCIQLSVIAGQPKILMDEGKLWGQGKRHRGWKRCLSTVSHIVEIRGAAGTRYLYSDEVHGQDN